MNPVVLLATWVMLQWTQPQASTAYEAQRGQAGRQWTTAYLYSQPAASQAPGAAQAGQRVTAYIVVTQDPRSPFGVMNGGQAIRIRYRSASGWQPWSNYVVVAGDLTIDSLYSDTGNDWAYAPPSRIIKWPRPYGDSALARVSNSGPVMPVSELCRHGRLTSGLDAR